jgi:hypothetical protein
VATKLGTASRLSNSDGECMATPRNSGSRVAGHSDGAGMTDRMVLITGFPVFLHTPCG